MLRGNSCLGLTMTTNEPVADDPLAGLAAPVAPPADFSEAPVQGALAPGVSASKDCPEQTAQIGVESVNMACVAIWAMPLDDDERRALERGLGAVLAK